MAADKKALMQNPELIAIALPEAPNPTLYTSDRLFADVIKIFSQIFSEKDSWGGRDLISIRRTRKTRIANAHDSVKRSLVTHAASPSVLVKNSVFRSLYGDESSSTELDQNREGNQIQMTFGHRTLPLSLTRGSRKLYDMRWESIFQ